MFAPALACLLALLLACSSASRQDLLGRNRHSRILVVPLLLEKLEDGFGGANIPSTWSVLYTQWTLSLFAVLGPGLTAGRNGAGLGVTFECRVSTTATATRKEQSGSDGVMYPWMWVAGCSFPRVFPTRLERSAPFALSSRLPGECRRQWQWECGGV